MSQTFDAFDAIVYLMKETKGVIIVIDLATKEQDWNRNKQTSKDLLSDRIMKVFATVLTIEPIIFWIAIVQSMALMYLFSFSFRIM